ncbi:MAG: biopolymer transporter ExbD [Phycisphaeraceae bacterium]
MSFTQPKQPHRRNAVPLAPMLDVMFLLLIFFVVTASFRAEEHQIEIDIPSAEAAEPHAAQRSEVIVNVREDGAILIGGAEYTPERLQAVLKQLVADNPNERVIVRGDSASRYERIIMVVDLAREAGIRQINFATVKQADQVGG